MKQMKNLLFAILTLALLGGSLAFSGEAAAKTISVTQAKKKALADAGLTSSEVTFTKAKLDTEDGISVYEIEFYTSSAEYEYELKASNGAILKKSTEKFAVEETTTQKKNRIGVAKAKKKALANAKLSSSEVTFTKAKLDTEDGVSIYEIKFYTDSAKYEYEIHAYTGKVLKKEIEKQKNTTANTEKKSYIGVSSAKKIALKHAGLSSSKVTFSKAKLDKEDGVSVYELEFYKGSMEYEYTIDAYSGKILEFESELED